LSHDAVPDFEVHGTLLSVVGEGDDVAVFFVMALPAVVKADDKSADGIVVFFAEELF